MSKFPYIQWYQTNTEVYITILNQSNVSNCILKDNFLNYNSNTNTFNVELYDTCNITKEYLDKKNNYNIILSKTNTNIWDYLLKNKNMYKYFITINWDKYNTYLKSQETNKEDFDEEEFNRLLKSGALDEISSDEDN